MKKYDRIFAVSCILATLAFFIAVYAFSATSYIPAMEGGLPSYPQSSAILSVLRIAAPICAALFIALAIFSFVKAKNFGGICSTLNSKASSFSPVYLFLICSAVILVCSLIYISQHRNTVWDHYIFRFGEDMFMDFFNHITYVRVPSEVYSISEHACFPPLIYIFYYLLSLFIPTNATVKHDASMTSPYAIVMYVMYAAICCIFLYLVVNKLLKRFGEKTSILTTLAIIVSSVFITVIERGNSVLIVLILLLASLYLRESDKKSNREMALIFIAIAAGIKIYPAIFGLIYVAEKKWRESLRLIAYGILFFFVPFVFFGGIDGLMTFISNQMAIHDDAYTSFTSISSSIRYISLKIFDDPFIWETAANIIPWVFTALALLAFFLGKLMMWEKLMLLISIITFVPAWSGSYTAVFFAIPMIFMFKQTDDGFGKGLTRAYNLLCTVCFTLAFSLIIFVLPSGTVLYEIRYIAMYTVVILVLVKGFTNFIRSKSKLKDTK